MAQILDKLIKSAERLIEGCKYYNQILASNNIDLDSFDYSQITEIILPANAITLLSESLKIQMIEGKKPKKTIINSNVI